MERKFTSKKIKAVGSLQEAMPMIASLESDKLQKGLLNVIKHDNVDIRIQGLKSLQKVGDEGALPGLIKALSDAGKKLVIGSEEATLHKIYVENLCKAIADITGEDYTIKNIADTKEFNSLVKKIKARPKP